MPEPAWVTEPPPPPALPRVGEPCEAELAAFELEVNRPVLVRQCAPCHNSAGPAAQTRLHLIASSAPDAQLHNWHAAGAFASLELEGESELILRATGRHPLGHPGGAVVTPSSAEHAALLTFVADATDPACNRTPPMEMACEGPAYGPRLLRRLTRGEYSATLEHLFAQTSSRGDTLAVDPLVNGFDNHARTLQVSALLADQLRRHAEEIGALVVRDLDRLLPCTPDPEIASECRDLFIRRFVSRAYRRPLERHEEARYEQLFDATSRGDFARGAKWVVTAALQSPHFLYRSELGARASDGTFRLNPYEIASALSFFLTGGPPDDALLDLARTGRLRDPEVREERARRMISSPAGQRQLTRFFAEWLALDRIHTTAKDSATYGPVDAALRRSMAQETDRFVVWSILHGGTLPELFTASYSFIDPRLEAFYEEPATSEPDADGFRRVEAPGRRFGLLTQGSLLAVHAKANEASPVSRGKLVRERILCEPLALPPPGVSVEPPPIDPNLTTRERYAAHSEVEPCRSCHRLIDPIGFGFGEYDGMGRHRPTEAGQPVDTSGQIVDSLGTNGEFEDLAGLAGLLAGSPEVTACFASKWQRWAYGLAANEGLQCALERAVDAFEASDLRVTELLVALARSEHMISRTATITR